MTGTGKTLLIAGVAAGALALGACTGGSPIATETPSGAATPTASASATPTPSPTGPLTDEELLALLPPEATSQDLVGAVATATFFLDEYQRAYETGDLRVWNALSLPDCDFCAGVVDNVEELHGAGGYREGGHFTFAAEPLNAARHADNGYFYVSLEVSWTPTSDVFPDGTVVPDGDGGSAIAHFELLENGAYWQVNGVDNEATG